VIQTTKVIKTALKLVSLPFPIYLPSYSPVLQSLHHVVSGSTRKNLKVYSLNHKMQPASLEKGAGMTVGV